MKSGRGHTRQARRVPGTCRLFFFGEHDFEGEAQVVDLSTSGCRATSEESVQVGMQLKLSFFLRDYPWPLRVDHAIVRWVEGQTFGVEFLTLRPAQRERLLALVMKFRSS